jgi:hypothetical protein
MQKPGFPHKILLVLVILLLMANVVAFVLDGTSLSEFLVQMIVLSLLLVVLWQSRGKQQ